MRKNELYTQPMEPWLKLKPFSKQAHLHKLNLDLFYFEAGNPKDPAIIMIHGLGDEADTWRHVFLPLAEQFHVVAVDLPGFGRSDKPSRDYTPDFMQSAILALMEILNISPAVLMGSSLGAILSHNLALTHPDKVSGLILADGGLLQTAAMGDQSLKLMALPLVGEWFYTHLRKNPQAAFDSLRSVYRDLDTLPKADREFLFTRVNRRVWSNGQRRAYFSTLRKLTPWVMKIQNGLKEHLTQLRIPTLVIRGEADQLFPEENAEGVLRYQPNASLATITKASHLPHQEEPEAFIKVISDWLSKNL